jgi:hypothetical protein
MKTSLTTSEHRIRDWLLDLLHSQWRALGVPFSVERPVSPEEAIDPEALLWCSLEFLPTQPRLREQALAWWSDNSQALLLPRIRKFARAKDDPRALVWRALDLRWRGAPSEPSAPCYGQSSVADLRQFCQELERQPHQQQDEGQQRRRQQPGNAAKTAATVILRARDVLGSDARHFVLVYLLATHGGARLRSIATWSGQSYRNIFRVAQRWESANVVALEHGFARLKDPSLWERLLELDSRQIVLLNWQRFYDACTKLLRSLAKAHAKSIPAGGPAVSGLLREAGDEAAASVETFVKSETTRNFRLLLSNL